MKTDDFYYLGKITKTYGNKGQLIVHLDVDDPAEYSNLKSVFVDVFGELIPFIIEDIEMKGKNTVILSLSDVNTSEEAEEFSGKGMYLPMEDLPPLKGSQFYFHEVTGFSVTDINSGNIGVIESILDLNHQALFQIRFNGKEILIPVTDSIIRSVDREKKVITIEAPIGLIDIYL
jgi:16S rRNA processing protein RimM